MIPLVLPAGGGPNQVKLLAQYDDGEEVDIIKAGNVSFIRLRIEPDETPQLTVVFNAPLSRHSPARASFRATTSRSTAD